MAEKAKNRYFQTFSISKDRLDIDVGQNWFAYSKSPQKSDAKTMGAKDYLLEKRIFGPLYF